MVVDSDLMELPAGQASKAVFPPGCRVWIHASDPSEYCSLKNEWGQEYEIRDGVVQSLYLSDVFLASRKIYYKVVFEEDVDTEMVKE